MKMLLLQDVERGMRMLMILILIPSQLTGNHLTNALSLYVYLLPLLYISQSFYFSLNFILN